jgi:hypothetical protein
MSAAGKRPGQLALDAPATLALVERLGRGVLLKHPQVKPARRPAPGRLRYFSDSRGPRHGSPAAYQASRSPAASWRPWREADSPRADISGEVKRRFLPGLKAGVSTPRSR